jgi:hypothetical protein
MPVRAYISQAEFFVAVPVKALQCLSWWKKNSNRWRGRWGHVGLWKTLDLCAVFKRHVPNFWHTITTWSHQEDRRQFPNKFYRIYMTWVCFLEKGMGGEWKDIPHTLIPPLHTHLAQRVGSLALFCNKRSVLAWESISQNNAPHKRANINTPPSLATPSPHPSPAARACWSQGGW